MAEQTGRRGVLCDESAAGFDTAMVQLLSLLSGQKANKVNWLEGASSSVA